MRKLSTTFAILAIALVLAWLAVSQLLGRGFDTDLAKVGQGIPTLVLAFENFSPTGMGAMDLLNEIRGDYEARMQFLVADLGVPEGRAFAERHGIRDGSAVFLDGKGEAVSSYPVTGEVHALRQQLNEDLRRVR